MNQKPKKQAIYWLKVAVIGIALGFALQFVRAWTEPTVAPPGGNVGAPINTGPNLQTKSGSLNVSGSAGIDHGIWGGSSNSTGYGVGGANTATGTWGTLGHGGWGGVFSGPVYTNGAIQMHGWDSQLYQGYGAAKRSIGGAQGWDPNKLYINGWGDWTSGVSVGGGAASNLSVYGNVQAYRYYDDDSNYYIDSNSTSRMNYAVTDNIYNYGTISTPWLCLYGDCRWSWPGAWSYNCYWVNAADMSYTGGSCGAGYFVAGILPYLNIAPGDVIYEICCHF